MKDGRKEEGWRERKTKTKGKLLSHTAASHDSVILSYCRKNILPDPIYKSILLNSVNLESVTVVLFHDADSCYTHYFYKTKQDKAVVLVSV